MVDTTIDNSGSTPATSVISAPAAKSAKKTKAAKKPRAAKAAKPTKEAKAAALSGKKIWIQVDKHSDIPTEGLSISVNGQNYTVPAGEPTQIEDFVAGAIDASRFTYSEVDAPKGA